MPPLPPLPPMDSARRRRSNRVPNVSMLPLTVACTTLAIAGRAGFAADTDRDTARAAARAR